MFKRLFGSLAAKFNFVDFLLVDPVIESVISPTAEEGFISIKKTISRHYTELNEVAKNFQANSSPSVAEIHSNPIVLCLGNHSSGKSSFINFILGQDIQKSSAAPLDDCFTLFTYGKPYNANQNFVEQSGAGLALNTKMPFHSLSTVQGSKFLNRVKLKYVKEKKLEEIMLVDTPGMIDATQNRDYDFGGAIQWFSERADLVLFFFDPEKPGTSAESLAIFSQVLKKVDHKLIIVLNKVDSFTSVNDFARTYGTLCWNLAKVISFKDMPMIYTSHLPDRVALPKFENSLDDLQRKIFSAPARHVDTLITDFQKFTKRLEMHCRVASHFRSHVSSAWWISACWILLIMSTIIAVSYYVLFQSQGNGGELICAAFVILCGAALCFIPSLIARQQEQRGLANLDKFFKAEFFLELRENRQATLILWEIVKPELQISVEQWGVLSFPRFGTKQQQKISHILSVEVQCLLDSLQKAVST